jgi:hypothetical protein
MCYQCMHYFSMWWWQLCDDARHLTRPPESTSSQSCCRGIYQISLKWNLFLWSTTLVGVRWRSCCELKALPAHAPLQLVVVAAWVVGLVPTQLQTGCRPSLHAGCNWDARAAPPKDVLGAIPPHMLLEHALMELSCTLHVFTVLHHIWLVLLHKCCCFSDAAG